jgi:5-methylcytosine-specific restriction protein A
MRAKGFWRAPKGKRLSGICMPGTAPSLQRLSMRSRHRESGRFHCDLTQPLDDDDEAFPEGRVLTREHKTRERNRRLVEKKKKAVLRVKGKLECEVCEFDFLKTYHELGREFIECHHLAPLSDLREERKTKLSELGIVCANCHRMLHRARPWKTIDDLKSIIAKSSGLGNS